MKELSKPMKICQDSWTIFKPDTFWMKSKNCTAMSNQWFYDSTQTFSWSHWNVNTNLICFLVPQTVSSAVMSPDCIWEGPDCRELLPQLFSRHNNSTLKYAKTTSFPILYKFSIHIYSYFIQCWIIFATDTVAINTTKFPMIRFMKHKNCFSKWRILLTLKYVI
jgi:hypothetical protein